METLKSIIDGVVSISTVPSSTENLAQRKDNPLKNTPSGRKSSSTLKFLVSQSLLDQDLLPVEHRYLLNSHYQKSQVQVHCKCNKKEEEKLKFQTPTTSNSNFLGPIQLHGDRSGKTMPINCNDSHSNENYSSSPEQHEQKNRNRRSRSRVTAGSGDVSPVVQVQESNFQSRDVHMSHLLSTAYVKGSEFLHAIFGEEQNERAEGKDVPEEKKTVPSKESETPEIPSTKSNFPTQVDDIVYYNGYGIRVKGQGVKLDTLFMNGSGPSAASMEIHISLLHDSNGHGNINSRSKATTQSVYDPEENRLTIKYTHGVIKGFIQITCPLEMNVNELKNEHKGNCLIITAP